MTSPKLRVAPQAVPYTVDEAIADSVQLVTEEIKKFAATCRGSPSPLDPLEVKTLSSLVDLALKLSREERESKMATRLDDLSDDKLDALLQEAVTQTQRRSAK